MTVKKAHYEGYSTEPPTILLREKLGNINIYAKKSQSLLNKATGFISAYDFTLNPYRGCQYGCSYCYAAAFSPNPQMRADWGNWVIIKENAAQLLRKELTRWQKKHEDVSPKIYMSTVTDPYQPIESKWEITRDLLEIMVEYKTTLVIQTRSPIITRDIDFLQRLKNLAINMSIPTGSESVRKDFEPRSPSIKARLNALKKIKQNINPNQGYMPKLAVTITPTLPTLPKQQNSFIEQLQIVDRVVLQPFHSSGKRSLVATTRNDAETLKAKYAWWYENEEENYHEFREKLVSLLPNVEIKEGKAGFVYE